MKLLGAYKNGNFMTSIFSDGTKIRKTEADMFVPDFAENIDIKISDYCDGACAYCHEGSSVNGKHAELMNEAFVNTFHPYQELAIGGGDATSHPDLIPFLRKLAKLKVIANLTVNQKHFEAKQDLIRYLVDEQLIYGLGVSLENPTDDFISMIKEYPNAVIHVINGVVTPRQIYKLVNHGLKILILGYKDLRRGHEYLNANNVSIDFNQNWLYENIEYMFNEFKVVSFDNLAIEQLNIKRLLSDEEWSKFYMGDDSEFTFYIDLVNRKFAKSSTVPIDQRYDIPTGDDVTIDDLFSVVKKDKE